jgi:hypothetical protein
MSTSERCKPFFDIGQKSYLNVPNKASGEEMLPDSQSSDATAPISRDGLSNTNLQYTTSGIPYEISEIRVSKTVAVEEILPHWRSILCASDDSDSIGDTLRQDRRVIQGVHHAKYIMIFTDRGLYVAISTSNMSKKRSTDGTWTEFFPRTLEPTAGGLAKPVVEPRNSPECVIGRDFGKVLQNFLEEVGEALLVSGGVFMCQCSQRQIVLPESCLLSH